MRPHDLDRFLGQVLAHVSDDLRADARKHGFEVNVLDPDYQRDIDVEANRLNVRVDAEFRSRRSALGDSAQAPFRSILPSMEDRLEFLYAGVPLHLRLPKTNWRAIAQTITSA